MKPAIIVVDMLKDNFKYRNFALYPLLEDTGPRGFPEAMLRG